MVPGINLWWKAWEVDRKRQVLTKSNYSRLVNFKRAIDNDKDIMINRHRIHMKSESLMKRSFVFAKLTGFSKLLLGQRYKYYGNPVPKSQPLILAKIKPSLSSLCNIPIIYDYQYLWPDD